jgi:ABC-2 type transport system ATP-binding protein
LAFPLPGERRIEIDSDDAFYLFVFAHAHIPESGSHFCATCYSPAEFLSSNRINFMTAVIAIKDLKKVYASGFEALKGVSLDIKKGEIFALLGPNGAGKTTLIGAICGLIKPSSGSVTVNGYDIVRDFRETRKRIGLVPQEIALDIFATVWNTVAFSRGLFGLKRNDAYVEKILRDLSLWDKKDSRVMALSGGMKRRVNIAKALSHEPEILFLDEPTAGVDVELRQGMWEVVRRLRDSGVTIILTTHYIAEAEEMADRIGVINQGEIVLVEEKHELMRKLGKKQLLLFLKEPIETVPGSLADQRLTLSEDGSTLTYDYDTRADRTGITRLLSGLNAAGISFQDIETRQSSLEDIFIHLVEGAK